MNTALNYIKNSHEDMITAMLSQRAKNSPMATPQLRVLLKIKHACKQ
jgi:hypothetical protein